MKNPFTDNPRTARSRFTRICIGKALVELLAEKPFEDIRVTDIVQKAGVSRMTYYKYYAAKPDVLKDYLHELIVEYDNEQRKHYPYPSFDKEKLLHCILFFERYSSLLKTLIDTGQHTVLLHRFVQYVSMSIRPSYPLNEYEVYFYCCGAAGLYIRWIQKEKRESPQELADILWELIQKIFESQYFS